MINFSKILLICLTFTFSSLSFAESVGGNEPNANVNQIDERIDINHADIKTLSLLKGIGMKKAAAIVKYRNENGKFISVEDLLNVKGIGGQILALNKSKLTI
ncbi:MULTISPECIES: helix-hairpin-helix domain-containing protein [unclassified Colwellia]|uniref:ComEA family DNA-binding protein n=1 Tax=unclassified Colwellia TaxID=196834 RepID=UPI0015F6FFC2|nr:MULTISPECIES: helix-hairpin-helix domain-containing protein [unclassified Colwellia]MBA6363347.1 helix-hairpin-helix domain-containing protein [Colwellia sp. BRX8-8]MBA6349177.1 helix-hairpin-helix domain-containing protein [Colwellia sp. BRX8-9]MBA6353106.1 helix-hairpin-helix domain-containing protein [Colwellia sp. BRX9-1]MBA6356176.1 helix-hairpin-helix domain-containing protein [Colwellia sp. BRX8-3]MBA6359137.1 helix-hairpin-helix domain-containing protein [Colwellia sp. BRX8-6]|tara:strand:+ start:850 stop:1155 length:306 start_codon:yes stop_codon:yes gene_type:complete